MANLKGRDLKGIADFSREEIQNTLEVSGLLKRELQIGRAHRLLEGKSLGGIFETPSTRTSISFEIAMTQLGGHMLWLDEHRLWVGAAEEEGHRQVGQRAAACAHLVFVVGERARPLYEAARTARSADVRFLTSAEEAAPILGAELQPGDHLLVKASRAVALESVVDALVAP